MRSCFDAYVTVDWSANNSPKKGKDSIWYCVSERASDWNRILALENPATRSQAFEDIRSILKDLARRERATLVGFDFPYGFPRGFAKALNVSSGEPWREVWNLLASRIIDDERNRSNRFRIAADLNAAISGQPFPFWGCPAGRQETHLSSKRSIGHTPASLPEFRFTDRRSRGPQPVWKLCYPGSVGSQTLVGIPYVSRLRFDPELAACSRVWPFETGFQIAPRAERHWKILHAEIYPSIKTWPQHAGESKDRAQVRGLAGHFANEDGAARLGSLFQEPSGMSPADLDEVLAEEGWILGIS